MNQNEKSVMVFGTFDVFHPGHRFFIAEAMKKIQSSNIKAQKKSLVVVVARDKTVKKLKGVLRNSEKDRQKVLQESFPDAKVVLGDLDDPMKVVRKFMPGLICLGYDQSSFEHLLEKEFPEIEIVRIGAYKPEKYKSSKM